MCLAPTKAYSRRTHPFVLVGHLCFFVKYAAGRSKALLIAIRYTGERWLLGPHRDVKRVKGLLIDKYQYKEKDTVVLMDGPGVAADMQPTHDNIVRELQSFLSNQRRGDRYFFYYAGHSEQLDSNDPDEEDGKDEYIVPSDAIGPGGETLFDKAIIDDVLKLHLVTPLSSESRLVAILDSCHSATLLDLSHFRCNGVCAMSSLWRRCIRRVLESSRRRGEAFVSVVSAIATQSSIRRRTATAKCSGYCSRSAWSHNVICISACKDNQKSYEARDGTSMSTFIVDFLGKEPCPTLKTFMRRTTSEFQALSKQIKKEVEHNGFDFGQIAAPQMSSPLPLNMNKPFGL